jgi:Ca2+-binding RTX toxin-like protein
MSPISEIQTFNITAVRNPIGAGAIYQIDGVNYPALTLARGGVYTFDQSDVSNINHPLAFRDSANNSWTQGVVTTGIPGQFGAQTVFTVPSNAPDGLKYYCTLHGNGMGESITVVAGSSLGDSAIYGSDENDVLFGGEGNDTFIGSLGNDSIDGGSGFNTVKYSWSFADMDSLDFSNDGIGIILGSNSGSDTLSNINKVQFSDGDYTPYELRDYFTPSVDFSINREGLSLTAQPLFFTGDPSLGLHYQLIDTTPNTIVAGSALNDFIVLQGGGNKAVNGGGGNDVIDGGVGSTFISGGGGNNTFFLDGRAAGVSWSTITDFEVGVDKATVWGWRKGISKIALIDENGGAAGFDGLTLHFENLLPSEASDGDRNSNWNSITLSGKSLSDFGVSSSEALIAQINAETNPYFSIGQTPPDQFGVHGYLHIA